MKKLLPLVFAMLAFAASAQVNFSGMNYQAVVRAANGDPLPNQSVGVRFTLGCGVALPFTETHSTTTDGQGLIKLVIGEGTPGSGIPSFGEIDWNGCGASPWVLEVAMDVAGGTNYVSLGTQLLKAVPFALNAVSADTLTSGVHWELVGNEVQNTGGGPVRVMENMWVQGGVFLNNAVNFPGWDISGQTGSLTFNELFQGPRLTLEPGGNVGVGTQFPDTTLHVVGALKLQNGSQGAGKVLTSDANGLASWQNLAGGSGHWLANGSDVYNTNSGNVGIGVPAPTSKLHVNGSFHASGTSRLGNSLYNTNIKLNNYGTGDRFAYIDFHASDAQPDYSFRIIRESGANGNTELGHVGTGVFRIRTWNDGSSLRFNVGNNGDMMNILDNGNVGIGTTAPSHLLDVRGNMRLGNDAVAEQDIEFRSTGGFWQVGSNNQGNGTSGNQFYVYDGTDFTYKLTVQRGTGNVGIGIPNPQSKLAVNGKITCKEVEVTLTGFPDHVFEADYDLMTLEEVEAYIKANGHLPKVPSACEVEENGIGLGELNKILLEKVEELTLHLIQQERKSSMLGSANGELAQRLEALEQLIKTKNQ